MRDACRVLLVLLHVGEGLPFGRFRNCESVVLGWWPHIELGDRTVTGVAKFF